MPASAGRPALLPRLALRANDAAPPGRAQLWAALQFPDAVVNSPTKLAEQLYVPLPLATPEADTATTAKYQWITGQRTGVDTGHYFY
jgi:hypothetical protein